MSLSKSISDNVVFPLFLTFQWLSVVLKVKSKILVVAYRFHRVWPLPASLPLPYSQLHPGPLWALGVQNQSCVKYLATWHVQHGIPHRMKDQSVTSARLWDMGSPRTHSVGHPRGLRTAPLYRQSTQRCSLVVTKGTAGLMGVGLPPQACACTEFSLQRHLEWTQAFCYLKRMSHGLPQTPLKKHPYCLL